MKKNIDLYISDSTMIWYLGGVYEVKELSVAPMIFTEELLGWAVRRSDFHCAIQ